MTFYSSMKEAYGIGAQTARIEVEAQRAFLTLKEGGGLRHRLVTLEKQEENLASPPRGVFPFLAYTAGYIFYPRGHGSNL